MSANLHRPELRVDWSDLQVVLAVVEAGSLAAAARGLGVDHTTVLRRIAAFEKQLGVRLFERKPTGYTRTAAADELAATARGIQDAVHDVERRLAGRDLRVTGNVRITSTDTLSRQLLPAALASFAADHPGIELELSTTNAMVSLTKRDADIAVRPTRAPPETLVGRRVADVAFAIYAAPAYLARIPRRRALRDHAWLALDDSLAATTIGAWMRRELPGVRPLLRTDSLTSLCSAATAGHGVSALPCYLADRTPGLVRVRGPIAAIMTQLWVLTHADLRHTPRVRAVVDHLVAALAADRALFEGRSPA